MIQLGELGNLRVNLSEICFAAYSQACQKKKSQFREFMSTYIKDIAASRVKLVRELNSVLEASTHKLTDRTNATWNFKRILGYCITLHIYMSLNFAKRNSSFVALD